MKISTARRTATKVVNGRVTRKNRSTLSEAGSYVIIREPAGRGYTHVVSARQLLDFLGLIPNWPHLCQRLERILLTHGQGDTFGYHATYRNVGTTVIALCAWEKKLWMPCGLGFFYQHKTVLDALGVECQVGVNEARCRFTVAQARAFSLLHVFIHEVGHHIDWMRRRGPGLPGKEEFAEEFADRLFWHLLPAYRERFGDPAVKAAPDPSP